MQSDTYALLIIQKAILSLRELSSHYHLLNNALEQHDQYLSLFSKFSDYLLSNMSLKYINNIVIYQVALWITQANDISGCVNSRK